jgi:hypothetical protein
MLNIFKIHHIATHGKPYLVDRGILQDLVEVSVTSWVTVFLKTHKVMPSPKNNKQAVAVLG